MQGKGNIPAGLAHTACMLEGEARQCHCGRYNCLELLHSLKAIRRQFPELDSLNDQDFILEMETVAAGRNSLEKSATAIAWNALGLARCLDIDLLVATGPMTKSCVFLKKFLDTVTNDQQNGRSHQRAVAMPEVINHPNPQILAAAAISLDSVFNERSFLRA